MGFFAMLGVLQVLEDNGKLSNVHEISGASAGSMIGLFLSIKNPYKVKDILETTLSIDVPTYTKLNLQTFLNNFGFVPHEPIKELLIELCRGKNPTFKQLKKKLIVSACCLNTQKTEYFSVDTHPNMCVIDAVCMSMTVPFLFETIKHNNFTYLDGGTCEIVPTMSFINKDPSEVVVLRLQINKVCIPEIKSIRDFIGGLIQLAVNNRTMEKTCYKEICIDLGTMNIFDFLMDLEGKLKLYLLGHQTTLTQLGLDK